MPRTTTIILIVLITTSIIAATISFKNLTILSIPNASAISTTGNNIGVYWNQATTNSCTSIPWGDLTPGTNKSFILYVRNQGNQSLYYLLNADNWNPANTPQFMTLRWSYDGRRTIPGSVLRVTLTLSVSHLVKSVTDFSFDIMILANHNLFGDVDSDGDVDILDMATLVKAFGSSPGSAAWNPNADVNLDGNVDTKDLAIATKNFGKAA